MAVPWLAITEPGQVATTGALGSEPWLPRPSNVSFAKPSHWRAGSNASDWFVSPASIPALRRSVLSAVLVSPLPHWVPGSKPTWPMLSMTGPSAPPLRRTTASLPLNQPAPLVWSAVARIAAAAKEWASTKTSPLATVPLSGIVSPAVVLPLEYISTR